MQQIIISGAISFFVSILLTPLLIRFFTKRSLGQEIREEGLKTHLRKRGTPTMGGIAILVAIICAYFGTNLHAYWTGVGAFSASGFLILGLTIGLGAVGFADDAIKLYKVRNLGLNKTAKLLAQLVVSVVFGILILQFPNENGLTPGSTRLSFVRDIDTIDLGFGGGVLGLVVFLVFIYIVISAWSNAVNITDGLDGLTAGATAFVMGAYTLITFWQFRNSCDVTVQAGCYTIRDPLDISILAAAGLGATLGFLWWNAAPAQIFMGDTGSLAMGGLIAGISIISHTELLMIIIGGLFVIEIASVVLQVGAFKLRGKRIFKMAPLHHHFESLGWAETTVVVRFLLIALLCVLAGMAMFYGDWLSLSEVHRNV